jgi:putative ABC transport system permease protein
VSRRTSWRLALRLARRDALRNRGRSILVLVMIALPVLAVTAADVVIQTSQVSGVEGLDRRLGAADAQIEVPAGGAPMLQAFDPYDGNTSTGEGDAWPTEEQVLGVLGDVRLVEQRSGDVDVRTDDGVAYAEATEVDLRDPLTDGLFDLTSGRWPTDPAEVVVNQAMLDQGYAVGDRLDLVVDGAPAPVVVGVAESTTSRNYPVAAGPVGSLGIEASTDEFGAGPAWLVGGGPVSWSQVKELNALGATVLSRAVVTDPPPDSEIPEEIRGWSSGSDGDMVAVIVLIVVMALLEVVLLAGPAFAVSARRQSRTLALLAATGGTPAQSRRVILGGGVVLGAVAAAAGVALGIALGWLLVPVVQHWSDTWFGPFDVPWVHLAGIALFGLASAFLATVVPAWIASRQDVVAVLAGRRADKRPSLRSPILGVVLLGLGIAGSAYGATSGTSGEYAIAASAVLAVFGMIFLVPIVVVGVAKLAGRLPLSPRYAARDAARHRTRTVPAVAAVAATVAGVVALGIGVTSDEAENRGTYRPELPYGMGSVTAYSDEDPVDWVALRAAAERELPDATLTEVRGVIENASTDGTSFYVDITTPGSDRLLESYGSSWGASTLVGRGSAELPMDLSAADRAAAARVLGAGGVVAFSDRGVTADEVTVSAHRWEADSEEEAVTDKTFPALILPMALGNATPQGILSEEAARKLDLSVGPVGLLVSGAMSADQEQAAREALASVSTSSSFYVERGYQAEDDTVIAQLVLAALGGILMLGGTLTATFLALADARPDLATLAAVGASPRRRRWVAASYALVIGFVGGVLGAAVGFIPGIAVTYPLTRGYSEVDAHFLDIPWLMILGLVVGLPLLTAVIVGLCARSRLPLVARLD